MQFESKITPNVIAKDEVLKQSLDDEGHFQAYLHFEKNPDWPEFSTYWKHKFMERFQDKTREETENFPTCLRINLWLFSILHTS